MVFLAVIPSKYIKFIFEKSSSVVFDLWSLNYLSIVIKLIRFYSLFILVDVIEQASQALGPHWGLRALFIPLRNKHPF